MDENIEKEYPVKNMLKGKERRTDERKLCIFSIILAIQSDDFII